MTIASTARKWRMTVEQVFVAAGAKAVFFEQSFEERI
jgi:hypothetical protein